MGDLRGSKEFLKFLQKVAEGVTNRSKDSAMKTSAIVHKLHEHACLHAPSVSTFQDFYYDNFFNYFTASL